MDFIMKHNFDINEVKSFIENVSLQSCIYIGSDSIVYKSKNKWLVDYTTVVVIHYDGCRGCKIFGKIETEQNYDKRKERPSYRLMNEVIKAGQMYLDLADAIGDRYFEVHLDINPDIVYGSSFIVNQAVGYIKGVCNVMPKIKPNSFAATQAADRFAEII
jgi:predicted RNase H-related nuclease YkuK (DUF458 family)